MGQNFQRQYSDYPIATQSISIEQCEVSDSDIPSENGGINGEDYSYGQLRHHPVIPELMRKIFNPILAKYAKKIQ